MYKYFVSFSCSYQDPSAYVFGLPPPKVQKFEDDTVIELDYKIDSEESLYKLRNELRKWKLSEKHGHVHIKSLTLLS